MIEALKNLGEASLLKNGADPAISFIDITPGTRNIVFNIEFTGKELIFIESFREIDQSRICFKSLGGSTSPYLPVFKLLDIKNPDSSKKSKKSKNKENENEGLNSFISKFFDKERDTSFSGNPNFIKTLKRIIEDSNLLDSFISKDKAELYKIFDVFTVEKLTEMYNFISKSFLETYGSDKGVKNNIYISLAINSELVKSNGLSLFFNENTSDLINFGEIKEFREFFAQLNRGNDITCDREGICHVCLQKKSIVKSDEYTRMPYKFFITDKRGHAYNGDTANFNKCFSMCPDCLSAISASYSDFKKMRNMLLGTPAYFVPEDIFGNKIDPSIYQEIQDSSGFSKNLRRLNSLEENTNGLYGTPGLRFHIMLVNDDSRNLFKLRDVITEVIPSNISSFIEAFDSVLPNGDANLTESVSRILGYKNDYLESDIGFYKLQMKDFANFFGEFSNASVFNAKTENVYFSILQSVLTSNSSQKYDKYFWKSASQILIETCKKFKFNNEEKYDKNPKQILWKILAFSEILTKFNLLNKKSMENISFTDNEKISEIVNYCKNNAIIDSNELLYSAIAGLYIEIFVNSQKKIMKSTPFEKNINLDKQLTIPDIDTLITKAYNKTKEYRNSSEGNKLYHITKDLYKTLLRIRGAIKNTSIKDNRLGISFILGREVLSSQWYVKNDGDNANAE